MFLGGKKLSVLLAVALGLFLLFSADIRAQESEQKKDAAVYVFYGQGCPHCASLLSFLDDIKNKYPSLKIYEYEVYGNDQSRILFEDMADERGAEIEGVPTTFIGDEMIVGFNNGIGVTIEKEIKNQSGKDTGASSVDSTRDVVEPKKKEIAKKMTVSIVIGAAAVDAINPCAFAVLIILMTAALSIADKKRALRFGLAFTCSIYISYFLMGLGLFSILQTTKLSHGFYIFVTILAVFVGLMNLKDYFWYGKGFLMEVPLSWRPRMKQMISGATSPMGAFLVGFGVSLFELPCTGGPYIVILGLLAKEMTRIAGIGYLLLYNLVFILPLIILSLIIYRGISTTEKLEKIRQGKIKILHLISGIIMLMIAGAMAISIIRGQV